MHQPRINPMHQPTLSTKQTDVTNNSKTKTERITKCLKALPKESPNKKNIFLINFFKKYPNVYLKTFLSNIKFNVLKTNLKKTIIKKTLVSQHRNIEKFKIKHHEKRN